VILVAVREHRFRCPIHFTREESTGVADLIQSPVEEAALPELTKVEGHIESSVFLLQDVPRLNLVPRYQVLVVPKDRRRGCQAHEQLGCLIGCSNRWIVLIQSNNSVDDKMLADSSNDWPESLLELPIDFIVEHIE
jgi:hypothetical protein